MGTSRKRTQKELIEDFLSLCEQKYYAYALTSFESMNGRLANELISGGEEAIKKFMNRDKKDLTTLV